MSIQSFIPPIPAPHPHPNPQSLLPRRRLRHTPSRPHPPIMHTSPNQPPRRAPPRSPSPEQAILRPAVHDNMVLEASRTMRTIAEMSSHIAALRRQRHSLLLADLVARIRCEYPVSSDDPLAVLLHRMDKLSTALVTGRREGDALATLRAEIRRALWDVRLAMDPLKPSEYLRTSLEVARSSFLDIPGRNGGRDGHVEEAVVRGEMYALMVENVLLEELRGLRVLERRMHDAVVCWCPDRASGSLRRAAAACSLLGLDDYRVRGKTRLADAVVEVREEVGESVRGEVVEAITVLHNALVKSLETDLSVRRPAGEAMLLRPRIDDIPNFAVVGEGVLRGGQPSSRGLQWLGNYGVGLVIDLRGSDRENQWELPKCKCVDAQVGGGGMRFCNIPIEDFCTPTVEQVFEFVELVNCVQGKGGVVFVHCKAGIGRTGTMIACWRIFHGQSAEEALKKERLYTEGGGGLRQEAFVRQFEVLLKEGKSWS